MARRVPIWKRNEVYYYTNADGRRVSLRTKDRAEAIKRWNRRGKDRAPAEREPEEETMSMTTRPAVVQLPPPPVPAPPLLQEPEPAPSPPRVQEGPPSPQPPGDGGPDPLQNIGASAAAAQPDEVIPPGAAGPPPPTVDEAKARQIAEMLAGFAQLVCRLRLQSRGIDAGPVSSEMERRQVEAALPLGRRVAAMPVVNSWLTEAAVFVMVSAMVAREQEAGGKPIPGFQAEPPVSPP